MGEELERIIGMAPQFHYQRFLVRCHCRVNTESLQIRPTSIPGRQHSTSTLWKHKGPHVSGAIHRPLDSGAGADFAPAVQPDQAWGVGPADRLCQCYGERIQRGSRTSREETGILGGREGGRCGLRSATCQCEQVHAAPGGGAYDSVTTNGLPPSLVLMSGSAATASALEE